MPPISRRTRFNLLLGVAVAFLGVAVAAIALTIWGLRSDAIDDASNDTGNIATVLAEQTARSVQSIDLILSDIEQRIIDLGVAEPDEFRRRTGTVDFYRLLRDRLSRLSQADVITLADDGGNLVNSTRDWPPLQANFEDRDYFRHLKAENDRALYINPPVKSRLTDTWIIYFNKRINGTNGAFVGVVTIGVEIGYFRHIYEAITSLRNQSFLFLRRDGMVLVRHPDVTIRSGEKMPPSSAWYGLVKAGGGYYRSPGYFDSEARLVAVRPLRDYPLVVNVAVSETAALANWRHRAVLIAAGTLLAVLCSSFLLRALKKQFQRSLESEAKLAESARHDALTNLPNRVLLREQIDKALAQLGQHGTTFSIFVFDLDLFKTVNDSLGHPVGDVLLTMVADRVRPLVDQPGLVARFGGDEFAVLQIGSRDDAIVLASRLLDAVSASFEIEGHRINIGMSIGIARAPDNGMDGDQLLMNADIALYRAKAEGRNGFRFFEPEMDIEARTRRHLEVSLRESVSRVERSAGNDFILHYHDIINVATGAVCGREALVRWYHPERGMVAPNKFIRAAEELGLIIPLGKWIVGRACADAATWPETLKLAVNLSPAQFRDDSLVESIMVALQASGLAPDRLELEITESVLLKNNPHDISILHQLKDLGISIVLDDFGTGYSSLSYLRLFPFDKLKIDKSFVDELTRRADCAAIICAIAGLGRSLSITTTAEGVETQEQFGLLRAAGCTQVQGFLFGRPRPAADIGRSDRAQQPLQAS